MRYIQDPKTLELVPADEYRREAPRVHHVMPDIQPYKSMQTGEIIPGRRQHREHLRQHRLIEIGNEPIPAPKPPAKDPGLRDAIARAVYQR